MSLDLRSFLKNPRHPKYRNYLYYYFRYSFYLLKIQSAHLFNKKPLFKSSQILEKRFNFPVINFLRFLKHLPIMLPVVCVVMFFQAIKNKAKWIKRRLDIYLAFKDKTIQSPVDTYWAGHTVSMGDFKTAEESKKNLAWRFNWYPKFKELMELYGDHKGETVLDYGCGPGNDVVGFGVYSKAAKIIGMDVSSTALKLAQERVSLHRSINSQRIKLVQISDKNPRIPFEGSSVDYIYCGGVLHHVSNLPPILQEFRRILKPNCCANIMVYNYDSIYLKLFIAYQVMMIEKRYPGLNLEQSFSRSTDGENCPISICYRSYDFLKIGESAGFKCQFLGGYLSETEINCVRDYLKIALRDKKLGEEVKNFLRKLTFDKDGLPMYQGKYAGIGGVYKFYKN